MVAFHFPPLQGSTGVHRTVAFAKYLRLHSWEVTVLTAHPRAYPQISERNAAASPAHVRVVRAFALDAQRHLSIFGKYPAALARPDRWQSWIWGAFVAGSKVIREWAPDVLMSTYPIASAHVIAAKLHRKFGIPWVADLRDPLVEAEFPQDPDMRRDHVRIESDIVGCASAITVTTEGTAALYRERYPAYSPESIVVVPNGFDEEAFSSIPVVERKQGNGLRFLHSGVLYPRQRDPTCFFEAVAELKRQGALNGGDVEFVFRGSGFESEYNERLSRLQIDDVVKLCPTVPYAEALAEMASADACMIFQASNCNQQIPAKVYEYLYCGKPILAFTDPVGDTGRLLSSLGVEFVAPLDDKQRIADTVKRFVAAMREGRVPTVARDRIAGYSRRELTGKLARLLDRVIGA